VVVVMMMVVCRNKKGNKKGKEEGRERGIVITINVKAGSSCRATREWGQNCTIGLFIHLCS
jgi:hypothetical protein